MGAGGEFAGEEVPVSRRHEGHPSGAALAQVRTKTVAALCNYSF